MDARLSAREKKDIALFETVYEPGTLEAVAYRGGQEIGRDVIKTAQDDPGDPGAGGRGDDSR